MMDSPIRLHNPDSFRLQFMQGGQSLDTLLHEGYGVFFVVRVEEMIRHMRLPVPPAKVSTHTMMYMTEGFADMHVGSSRYVVRANECLFVPAQQVFSIGEVDVDSGKGFLFSFAPSFIISQFSSQEMQRDFEFLTVFGNPLVSLSAESGEMLHPLCERMLLEYRKTGLNNQRFLQSAFLTLLCEAGIHYTGAKTEAAGKMVGIANRFRELLFLHFREKQRVSDYAEMMHISSGYLNKAVRQATGKPPTRWIDETVLLEAKVLLHQTDLTISEIAAATGIHDQSYFSRLFRKYEGVTPLAFRKRTEKS